MIRLIKYTALLFVFFMLAACTKELDKTDIPDPGASFSEKEFPSSFDWKTDKDVQVNIKLYESTIIEIYSPDAKTLLHKSFYSGIDSVYHLQLNIPTYYNALVINGRTAEIVDNTVDIDFNKQKGAFKAQSNINDLVSYWSMDESSGTLVIDENANNNGELISGNRTQGISGGAIEFNGSSGLVSIPENDNLAVTNQITLTAWAKAYDYREAKIAQKGDWDGYNLGFGKWNGWKAFIYMEDRTYHKLEHQDGRPLLNEWYYIAMTYDGSLFTLYVNGVVIESVAVSGNLYDNGRDFSIGSDNGSQKFFNGVIDEVMLYNTALSAEEIMQNYQVMPNTDSDSDGVPDFQDDYPTDPLRAFNIIWPSGNPGGLAFEDLWPAQGDFDFNDLVIDYQFQTVLSASNKVVESYGNFTIKAVGASQRNGFGFQLSENFPNSTISVSGSELSEGIVNLQANGTEANQDKTCIIVFDNSYAVMPTAGGPGVNVDPDYPYTEPVTVQILMDFEENTYTLADLDLEHFNPFIFMNRNRGHELHLPDYEPTSLMDTDYFGTMNDDSNPETGKYFKSENNVPWVISIPQSFNYPIEKTEITEAYLHFVEWAESSGTQFPDWYLNNYGYRNESLIYQ